MKNEGLISIIIPTFNRYDLIGKTLESIINQGYKNWECIIVDDNSTDYTHELVEFYTIKDERINFFSRPSSKIKGANSCRNYGFSLSKGEFVNWFDSDDLMLPDFMEKKINKITSSNKNCCICSFQSFSFDEGEILLKQKFRLDEKNIFENICLQRNPVPSNGPMWRRRFLEAKNLFNENITISQDLEFYSRILPEDSEIAIINEPLFLLRRGHANITSELYIQIEKHFCSYFFVRRNILYHHSHNLKIRNYYKFELLSIFRYLLGEKKYSYCKEILNFFMEKFGKTSINSKIQLIKIYLLFYGIRITGRGETKFKNYLKF